MFGMIVFLAFYLESSIPALNPSAYLGNSETPKFSQYLFWGSAHLFASLALKYHQRSELI